MQCLRNDADNGIIRVDMDNHLPLYNNSSNNKGISVSIICVIQIVCCIGGECRGGRGSRGGLLLGAIVTTLEEEEWELKLSWHWVKPKSFMEGHGIVNRCIKIYFEGNHEYFVGEVSQYDEGNEKHLIVYEQDL
eukprot:760768-Ditylum_brightwellii.AAC.1